MKNAKNNTGHTPGPYKLGLGMSNEGKFAIDRADGWPLAFVTGNDGAHNGGHPVRHDETVANAHLFVAAPVLLAACRKFDELLRDDAEAAFERTMGVAGAIALVELREAIAHAEGRC